ncbi:universal stress protein [Halobellus inordinatus]|uniref:universal stress protein n=1 Tax=Halobellus inordinatus TaxID=1126236 RepID=UPI002114DF25|nr:universal stress protein [Halobellus ramosii]
MWGDLPGENLIDADLVIREPPVILLPVEVLEGQTIPDTVVEFLAPADVIVLGYHVLPDQTPTEQASMQFEDRAQEAVDDIAQSFIDAGGEPETRVVFTHDREQTIDRVATEVGATAILLPNPAGEISEVLVPIRGAIDGGRLADLVATLLAGGAGHVTLWGIAAGEGSEFDAESAVDTAAERLRGRGLPAEQITTETTTAMLQIHDIVDRSDEADIIVMGEGRESLLAVLLGEDAERVAEGAVAPVLVVRDRDPDAEVADSDGETADAQSVTDEDETAGGSAPEPQPDQDLDADDPE